MKIFLTATVDWCLHTTVGQLQPQVLCYTICLKPKKAGAPVYALEILLCMQVQAGKQLSTEQGDCRF